LGATNSAIKRGGCCAQTFGIKQRMNCMCPLKVFWWQRRVFLDAYRFIRLLSVLLADQSMVTTLHHLLVLSICLVTQQQSMCSGPSKFLVPAISLPMGQCSMVGRACDNWEVWDLKTANTCCTWTDRRQFSFSESNDCSFGFAGRRVETQNTIQFCSPGCFPGYWMQERNIECKVDI
jgi:hypothetical protein